MIISPSTRIVLVNTPLTVDQQNQLTFESVNAQMNYFAGLGGKILEDYTYQRESGILRAEISYEDALKYNYCYYQNKAYSNKWFFAFLVNPTYLNDAVTTYQLKTDIWQTYQFDFKFYEGFVERAHVYDDTIGKHTIPENLETGEFIPQQYDAFSFLNDTETAWCVQVSEMPISSTTPAFNRRSYKMNGMISGTEYLYFDMNEVEDYENFIDFINIVNRDGKSDAIISIFPIPKSIAPGIIDGETEAGTLHKISGSGVSATLERKELPSLMTLDGYRPHNNKLLTYPYRYLVFNNMNGGTAEYRYEDFDGAPTFVAEGCLTSGLDMKMYPINYRYIDYANGYGYGCSLGKVPLGSWVNDIYANWLALNSATQSWGLTEGVLGGLGNIASGIAGAIGASAGGMPAYGAILGLQGVAKGTQNLANSIGQFMSKREDYAKIPAQTKGDTANSPLTFVNGKLDGGFFHMTIKYEYAVLIDKYFDMFGYQINSVEMPVIKNRKNWNYLRMPDVNVAGNIPQPALEELKSIFGSGITFWHNPATMLDYTQNNDII